MFLVAGGTGQTGNVVARSLLARGEPLRLFVRDAARVREFTESGVEVVVGELSDAGALTRALEGVRGAYLLVPPVMMARDILQTHERIIEAFAKAVRTARPEHIVCLSSVGAHEEQPVGPVWSLQRVERALRAVTDHVTFVRPAYFMESLAMGLGKLDDGVYPTFLRADLPISMVASRDVGTCAARELLAGPKGHRIVELEGPRSYTVIEAASELSGIVHRPIRVQEMPESEIVNAVVSQGMSEQTGKLTYELMHAINTRALRFELPESERERGSTPVHEVLASLLARRPT